MDYVAPVADSRSEDHFADRMRLDAFRLGRSNSTSNTNQHARKLSHARSHSRSQSVTLSSLVSTSATTTVAAVQAPDSPPESPPLPNTNTNHKRNSHHRRRSSVSTRRESAEIMGVSLPTLPTSVSEDNINLGDKDSIRRRALWALEGKTDVGAFSKVEIPELNTPEIERRFEFPTKPSYPPGIGAGFGGSLSGLSGSKRDSFGRFSIPCVSKEQLHTLLEEEEEEEEAANEETVHGPKVSESPQESPATPAEETVATSQAPARHRPAGLNLRPLSLAAATIVHSGDELPTPLPTPSPRLRPGLKSLTLAGTPATDTPASDVTDMAQNAARKRQSLVRSPSPVVACPPARRSSSSSSDCPPSAGFSRRTSISYFHSKENSSPYTGLPTPDMTPTSERRYSNDSVGSDTSRSSRGSRSMSTNEHHFLYQAHAALVQRISDLERALSARPRSRPQSCTSEASSTSEAPNDEMFQLITDLKAERDELKKDVDGWRTRVSDGERQATLLMNRVEAERREAWVARERMGLLEVEKRSLETLLQEKVAWAEDGWRKLADTEKQLAESREECEKLRAEVQRRANVQSECLRLAAALAEERKRRESVERELEGVLATPTPGGYSPAKVPQVSRTMVYAKRSGLGFRSVDSTGSNTDVESLDDCFDRQEPSLKVVQEEDESDYREADTSMLTDEDELAMYEEEQEDDSYAFQGSMSDSSFDSGDEAPRDTSHLLETSVEDVPSLTETRSNTASPAPPSPPQPHTHRNSLIKSWTFPIREEPAPFSREPEEVDRFFRCLEDVDNSPPLGHVVPSAESAKNLFSRALAEADDDDLPFVIPTNVGIEISESRSILEVVIEEDEEEETEQPAADKGPNADLVGEEVEGGIIFTFSPPSSEEPTATQPEDVSSADGHTSNTSLSIEREDASATDATGPSPNSSSSRIPVPKIITASPPPIVAPLTPAKPNRVPFPSQSPGVLCTPPPRRDSLSRAQSFNMEAPLAASTPKYQPPSFIPQPSRKFGNTVGSPIITPPKAQSKPRMLDDPHLPDPTELAPSQVVSPPSTSSPEVVPISSPVLSPTLAARISLQLTNFIPSLPWSSPVLGQAASAAASLCLVSTSSSSSSVSEDPQTSPLLADNATPSGLSTSPQARRYTSREQQLQKLRARLETESRSKTRALPTTVS